MKKLILFLLFFIPCMISYSQQRIRPKMMMLMQLRIPIQPDDKSWVHWYEIPNPKDTSQIIRIDRKAQGYAPFIALQDAPYYSVTQVKEIQYSLERILNPDNYFSTEEEYMRYSSEFMEKWVFIRTEEVK
jgi:hypothetical protein